MAALPTDALGDLFLLYSNAARRRKVVLSASDTMYAVRLSTARTSDALRAFSPAAAAAGACAVTAGAGLDSINRAGFEKMLRDCPGLLDGVSVDVNYVFMENLGDPTPRRRRFELSFDQFLDALASVAVAKYPSHEAAEALMELYERFLRPLYTTHFGVPAPRVGAAADAGGLLNAGGGDGGSVVVSQTGGAGGLARATTVRQSRVVLTPRGVAPASSEEASGAAVPLVVGTRVESAALTGAVGLLPGASGAGSVIDLGAPDAAGAVVRRRQTTLIGSSDAAVPLHQSSAAGGASATGRSVRRSGAGGNGGGGVNVGASASVGGGDASIVSEFLSPLPALQRISPARRPMTSSFSIDPYSREARGGVGGTAADAPSPASPAAAPAPTRKVFQDATGMIAQLVDAASEMQRELEALRVENAKLRDASVGRASSEAAQENSMMH